MKESYYWVRNCILSSTNNFHLQGCEILIQLFKVKFEGDPECDDMVNDLKMELRNKEAIISIEA